MLSGYRKSLFCFLALWITQQGFAAETTVVVPDGTTYRIEISSEPVSGLSDDELTLFEMRRVRAREELVGFLHSQWGISHTLAIAGRTKDWLLMRPLFLSVEETIAAHIQSAASALDDFYLRYPQGVVRFRRHGIRVSVGVAAGLAVARWGIAPGRWLTLNIDFGGGQSKGFERWLTWDRENLELAYPWLYSGGVGVKIQYFLASDTLGAEEGVSYYPFMVLPHTQRTDRSVSAGYSFGLFFPPSFWTFYLQQRLRRSEPIDVARYATRFKGAIGACWRLLLGTPGG